MGKCECAHSEKYGPCSWNGSRRFRHVYLVLRYAIFTKNKLTFSTSIAELLRGLFHKALAKQNNCFHKVHRVGGNTQEQIATPVISQYKRIFGTIPKSLFTDSRPSPPTTGNKHDVDGKLTAAANLESCAIFLVAEQVRVCCNLPECSLATSSC